MAQAEIVLVLDGREVSIGWVGSDGRDDLSLVDELARLQLAARRYGWSIRLRGASRALADLLDLAGLAAVLPREPAVHQRPPAAGATGDVAVRDPRARA